MSELINRQMAIDAIKDMYRAAEKWLRDATDDVTKARAESCMASLVEIKLRIEKIPVVQPDHVADISKKVKVEDCIGRQMVIDALDMAIERYDEMAEEYRKKADIERNDYMDMRDDAYEAQQLAQWLNELKYLRGKIEQLTIKPQENGQIKRWIYHPEWEEDGGCAYECPICGMGSDCDYNFCMRCGTKLARAKEDN